MGQTSKMGVPVRMDSGYFACLFAGMALIVAGSCKGPGPKKIGEATLAPLAAGGKALPAEAKNAPLIVMLPGAEAPEIPVEPTVKLAIDRKVKWSVVKGVIEKMHELGQTPILLVAERQKVVELHLTEELYGPPLEVYAQLEGKLCVKHPQAKEMICTQTYSKKYIDGAHTRELVRKAVLGYERADVELEVRPGLNWGDVVTAVGATRSCCGDRQIRVRVINAGVPG